MNHLTPKHFELLEEALELLLADNEEQMDNLARYNEHIVRDNSYCDSGTGYNLVHEYEYTEEYQELIDKEREIEELQKLLTKLEVASANPQTTK
jgi:hypothetical protein